MSHKAGFCAYLYGGSADEPFEHYSSDDMNSSRCFVMAEPGNPIAIGLHIGEIFDWQDANGLILEIFLDSSNPLVSLPIPRDPDSRTITINITDWPCWVPEMSNGVPSMLWKSMSFKLLKAKNIGGKTKGGVDSAGFVKIAWRRVRILDYHEGEDQTEYLTPKQKLCTIKRSTTSQCDDFGLAQDLTIGYRGKGTPITRQGRIPHPYKWCGGSWGNRNLLYFYIQRKARFDALMKDESFTRYRKPFRRINNTRLIKERTNGIPVSNFSEYFARLTALDPVKLFGKISEESVKAFRQDQALASHEDGDADLPSGRDLTVSTLQDREPIEISSDEDEDGKDDTDAIQHVKTVPRDTSRRSRILARRARLGIAESGDIVKMELGRDTRIKRELSRSPIEETMAQKKRRLEDEHRTNQDQIDIRRREIRNRAIEQELASLEIPVPTVQIKTEIIKDEQS